MLLACRVLGLGLGFFLGLNFLGFRVCRAGQVAPEMIEKLTAMQDRLPQR